jgi:hypothetical protein
MFEHVKVADDFMPKERQHVVQHIRLDRENLKVASQRIEALTSHVSYLQNLLRTHGIPFKDRDPFFADMNTPDQTPWKVEPSK